MGPSRNLFTAWAAHGGRLVAQPAQQAPRYAPEAAARRRSRHAALGGLPRQDRGAGQKPPRQALAAAAVLPVHPRLVPAGRLGLATLPASEARAADEAEAGVGVHGPPLRPALRRRVEGHGPPRLG